ncbi:sphingosine kinase 2 [Microcaecilia unicolor]|uniref:sphingosine kinase n=1 Tax=Microcaecilia unicolor TaxID=1415580 RepID=A0A6P7XSI0_9AMPH|nr:sphingosine kinase 2 [Microcaecilia unicolor]XP_030053629.1 sphingosine kinase 2 [Microcaecilia unicolor]XP_030053630.1 sphingosine kinase 2 [Microcaecilia unicolor]XP_030053631.1 sphingosine kinase 2 [Microcaecilia unicolor]XP_030053633.1 sphingosine kinase 2 [Microcaecilia unicolor]
MSVKLSTYREGRWAVETLLHGEFGAYPSKGERYALSLTCTALHIQRLVPKPEGEDQRTVVALREVAGCQTLSIASDTPAAYFSIYAYPRKKRKVAMGSSRTRQRLVRTFQVDGTVDYAQNQAVAERWAVAIKCLLLGVPIGSETEISPGLLPGPRRLLLLVNPQGGRGLALQHCHAHILPMISDAGISFNLIQTERQNHARELVQSLSLDEWNGIVIISGDGLLYEVINGLIERPDWKEAIRKPIGILPCGSGNALAGAINFSGGFEQALALELLLNCTLLLCHGGVEPMDLASITTCSGTRSFSFLSVAWGFISDVDIESEKYRHMGSARFTLGTAVRLASLRTYRGRLSYLPATDGHRPISRSITLAANGSLTNIQQHAPLHRTISDMGLCEERNVVTKRNSPTSVTDTGELPSFEASPSPALLDSDSFTFDTAPGAPPSDTRCTEFANTRQMYGPPDDLLVPLDEPVPQDWVTLEGDFVLVLAVYQTHLGADLFVAPFTSFGEGLIHLFFVKAGISRAALIRLFLAMERGSHFELEYPHFTHLPVRAFRLEPLTHKGILTVDGERVEYGPIQGQIHRRMCNLITGTQKVKVSNS